MSADPEGDSRMGSSSDEADSDAMFPAENDPPGTLPQSSLNSSAIHTSGLTPPQSQDPNDAMETTGGHEIAVENGSRQQGSWEKSEFARSAEMVHEPGAAWNNKKARDEYQRAMSQIEDKGFSLKEFGDPFDETQTSQGNGN